MSESHEGKLNLHIIGGTYFEKCIFPRWEQLYGSGLRSVDALINLCPQISYHTCVGIKEVKMLQGRLSGKNVVLNLYENDETGVFEYLSPLFMNYSYAPKRKIINKVIREENVIKFGMVETEIKIECKNAVYDPQTIQNIQYLEKLESYAENYTMISNLNEGMALTNQEVPDAIAKKIFKETRASCYILKNGAKGAIIFTRDESRNIPCFKISTAWLIGSGDIFTSIYGFYWMIKRNDPFTAAYLASKATAVYCNTRTLPICSDYSSKYNYEEINLTARDSIIQKQLYLAAPFFSIGQLQLVNMSKNYLSNLGIKVFSPFHDVGVSNIKEVAKLDLEGLEKSDLVFALLDDYDPGTIFEIGYAIKCNKPIIIYLSNNQSLHSTMFEGTKCHITDDLSNALYQCVWALSR